MAQKTHFYVPDSVQHCTNADCCRFGAIRFVTGIATFCWRLVLSQVILITGASRGIGAATALLAARAGYAVAVNYSANSLAADEVVRQIREKGGSAITVQADVAEESQVLAMFEKVDAKLGRLSALVNNAGVVRPWVRACPCSRSIARCPDSVA
jgi:NAD(P)-dependent dehydrogenase (short-subunit alcohol dehydrogenase family)